MEMRNTHVKRSVHIRSNRKVHKIDVVDPLSGKITFGKFFGHLRTVVAHRWWVFRYCLTAGHPIVGLLHDLSKFSPTEFLESVRYYQGTRSPIDACKEANGVSLAWMHHKGRNPHHYEYWQDNFDKGGTHVDIPYQYALEMLCDYLGAGRAYMGKGFSFQKEYTWWKKKRDQARAMNPHTKAFLEECLRRLNNGDDLKTVLAKESKSIYRSTRST